MVWSCFAPSSVEIAVHGHVINKGCFDVFAVCFVGVILLQKKLILRLICGLGSLRSLLVIIRRFFGTLI